MRKTTASFLAVLLSLGLTACGNQAATQQPDAGSASTDAAQGSAAQSRDKRETVAEDVGQSVWEWQKDTPENQGMNGAALEGIHATMDTFPLLSSVIVKNGYIVDEYYKDGYDENSVFVLNSASKSVTSAIIGIAIDKGYIESVDVPISDYFPQVLDDDDPYWRQITIRHLLTHTSGISTTDDALWDTWRSADNWIDYILDLPIVSEPGSTFSYSTGNTHLLCAIVQQATGMTVYDFGKQYLFDPVGMDSVRIDTDPQGISDGGNNIWMTPYDMTKFGLLYRNGGVWEGQQIVPAEWVEQSTSVQFERPSGRADYGYQWWVRTFGEQQYAAYFAQGHAGQYIFVVPELELIVTFTSDYTGSTSIYWQLVNEIVAACEV
ncbi:MAG: serine hydrolase [Eubacteriales bacterium]|nr:serine hydrolase [Eubacteriales bacterium]